MLALVGTKQSEVKAKAYASMKRRDNADGPHPGLRHPSYPSPCPKRERENCDHPGGLSSATPPRRGIGCGSLCLCVSVVKNYEL